MINVSMILQAKFQVSLPLLVFGGISFLGALATMFLPETCNENLPSTIEDANEFGSHQGFGYCIMCDQGKDYEEPIEVEIPPKLLESRRASAIRSNLSLNIIL